MSNMIQTGYDKIFSTHDSSIVGSSNAFERNTTHTLKLNGTTFTELTKYLVYNIHRGLHSVGLVVYGSEMSKLPYFSSRRGREIMGEDSHSHSEI
ncbi:hypothetical protein HID58_033142, partial [Brassica napus]